VLFLDEQFVPPSQGIPAWDRGLLFGDGVFETLRGSKDGCFRLDAHLARLACGQQVLGIEPPKAIGRLPSILAEAVDRAGALPTYLRITVTRGDNEMGLATRGLGPSRLLVWAQALPSSVTLPPRLLLAKIRRPGPSAGPTHIKTCNYLPQILAKREAEAEGYDDALMMNDAGALVCATAANVFVFHGSTLRTPALADGCLPGVTRAAVIEAAHAQGMPCVETQLHASDLETADAVLLCNALRGLVPAALVRVQPAEAPHTLFVDHPPAVALQQALAAKVERERKPW
jgi:branched-chain amino acid aminotransferase